MSLSVRLVGPQGADVSGALLRLSGAETMRLAETVVRKGMLQIRAAAYSEFRSSGIGRRIWGGDGISRSFIGPLMQGQRRKSSNLGKFIRTKVAKRSNTGFTLTFEVKGLPAMVEEGGQTRPHEIAPKLAEFLVYRTKSGVLHVSKGPVQHPGGPVAKDPYLGPEIDRRAPRIGDDLQRTFDGHIERVTSKQRAA